MKLHLTKSLRAALLACVCGCVAATSQAMAESLTIGADLSQSVTAGDTFNAYDSVTVKGTLNLGASSGDISSTQEVTLDGGKLHLNNSWGAATGSVDRGTITLTSNGGTIEGTGKAIYTSIDGTGDLTIQGGTEGTDPLMYVYGEISNDGDVNLATSASLGGNWGYSQGNNLTSVKNGGDINVTGNAQIGGGATVENSGIINIAENATLTTLANSTVVLTGAIENAGALVLNGTLDVSGLGLDLSTLNSTAGSVYSHGTDGFSISADIYTTDSFISGEGSVSGSGTVKVSDTVSGIMLADGTFAVADSDATYGTVYYANTEHSLTGADMSAASEIVVADGVWLSINSTTGGDLSKSVSLGEGSTLNLDGKSVNADVAITLNGDATIRGYQCSMRGDVSGTGDLTLEMNTGTYYIKGDINNTGSVTIKGTVDFLADGNDIGTIGAKVTEVIVGESATLNFDNKRDNAIDLNLNGGTVKVYSNATMTLGSDSALTSGTIAGAGTVTVASGDTLTVAGAVKLGNGSTSATTVLALTGNTTIDGDGALELYGAKISASGTGNEISADLKQNWNVTLDVAENGVLTFSGDLVSTATAAKVVKTGAGTLIIDNTTINNAFTFNLEGGILDLTEVDSLGSLNVSDGTTIKLAHTLTLSGSLTLGSNVIFDVSEWEGGFTGLTEEFFSGVTSWSGSEVVIIDFGGGETAAAKLFLSNGVVSIPEPTTATLSLLALAGLAARRRRK